MLKFTILSIFFLGIIFGKEPIQCEQNSIFGIKFSTPVSNYFVIRKVKVNKDLTLLEILPPVVLKEIKKYKNIDDLDAFLEEHFIFRKFLVKTLGGNISDIYALSSNFANCPLIKKTIKKVFPPDNVKNIKETTKNTFSYEMNYISKNLLMIELHCEKEGIILRVSDPCVYLLHMKKQEEKLDKLFRNKPNK